jgi:hypothetical protein
MEAVSSVAVAVPIPVTYEISGVLHRNLLTRGPVLGQRNSSSSGELKTKGLSICAAPWVVFETGAASSSRSDG